MTDPELIERKGLENVVVADSELSFIDGEKPELIYRGYDIQDLAEHSSFEETAYLLWNGELPNEEELREFKDDLAERRSITTETQDIVENASDDAVPMEVLRTAVSAIPINEQTESEGTEEGKEIIAKIPTILAAYERSRNDLEPIEPREDLDTGANFLYMLNGEEPEERHAEILDTALLLHADHGINASTFTARVVSSTESDLFSAIVGAISALKGPLHGGANQDVMEMLIDIDDSNSSPTEYVGNLLDEGEKVPGIGHRVYRKMDPRAVVLKDIAEEISGEVDGPDWYDMLTEIYTFLDEEKGITDKGLYPNVDFFSGTVYYSLGIPVDMFVTLFALGRSVGWVAQVLEQYDDNRLLRPRAEYVGERDLEYVEIHQRE
ncbi:MAG: citrate/2-methylcitrate synthase [Halobacteria archaeon]